MSSKASPESSAATFPLCMIDALRYAAAQLPDNDALVSPGRTPITFRQLLEHVEHTVGVLNGFGLKRNSRVMIVMPSGAEAITATYAVMSACTAVLLNPEIKAEEFKVFLQRSKAEALVVLRGMPTPARAIAEQHGLRLIEIISSPEMPSGQFVLEGGHYISPTFTEPDDVAVLIPTSGTTGLPKLVSIQHRKQFFGLYDTPFRLMMSATPDNPKNGILMLPLFHIFGLSNLSTSLAFGLCIVATSGFNVDDFYHYIDTYRPMGFQALPAMLKTIVEAAPRYADIVARSPIQYISVASAPMSPELITEVRRLFGASIIISYGMTEIGTITYTSTIFENFFRLGSVGQPIVEIAIRDENGNALSTGEVGEVVVRKEEVFPGYEGDPDAGIGLVEAGWFHTGDLGYLDADNFLFLTGRLKETINRGGEKISPYEVEQTLLQHPSIAEAAVFGVPHIVLGEDLGAAVVVRDPAVTSKSLRTFLAERLAPQKVPSTILIVDKIPETPTGKKRRAALPQMLGLSDMEKESVRGRRTLAPPIVEPHSTVEQRLLETWKSTLGLSEISIHDDFFEVLGGTSMQAAQLAINVGKAFSVTLPVSSILEAPTIAEMATLLGQLNGNNIIYSNAIPLQPLGSNPTLFCIPGLSGQVMGFRPLSLHMGVDQPIYGLQVPGSDGVTKPITRVEPLAEYLVQTIRSIQPHGPYLLIGASYGGLVALEMAHILEAQNEQVGLLGLLDTALIPLANLTNSQLIKQIQRVLTKTNTHRARMAQLSPQKQGQYIIERLQKPESQPRELLPGVAKIQAANNDAMRNYRPRPYHHPIVYFSARQARNPRHNLVHEEAWKKLALGGLEISEVPGDHVSMMYEPNVQVMAEKLKFHIEQALNRTKRETA